jgi:hypothetical protein
MSSIEHELNDYLFLEFGMEEDEGVVSETWPFTLDQESGIRAVSPCSP